MVCGALVFLSGGFEGLGVLGGGLRNMYININIYIYINIIFGYPSEEGYP